MLVLACLREAYAACLQGEDGIVARETQAVPGLPEALGHLVGVHLRGTERRGEVLYLLTVPVGAGEEEGIRAAQPGVVRQDVGQNGGVGVPQVGQAGAVVGAGHDGEWISRLPCYSP
jgi:hypothetical protein